jgi:hypothetical protein
MSESNGDKARFGRERKRKILGRKRIREFREAPKHDTPLTATSVSQAK